MIGRNDMAMTILDTRSAAEFLAARLDDSVNIPVEDLAARVHELPVGGAEIRLLDSDRGRAARAEVFLKERGHPVEIVPFDRDALTSMGPSRARLWQPSPFLLEIVPQLPKAGVALDVACGTGRDAVFLGLQGYAVHAIDWLPDALAKATDLARRYGVSLRAWPQDVERDPRLPVAAYDLVTVFRFLHRPLFPVLVAAVKQGGYLVYETFHERTLETGRSPRSPGHLLKTGELGEAFGGEMDVLIYRDAVERDGRYVSQILARRRQRR